MKNQEAIKILDNLKPGDYSNPYEKGEAIVMAIEALQAQDSPKPTAESVQNVQNEDLILRKAAIEALGERPMVWTDDDQYALGERNQYDMNRLAIETLPSAQPEPQWIPVSKRLPDMPIRVLVQLDNGWIITAYRQDNEWFSVPDFGEAIKDKWVEAWMPFPEPYREERRTNEDN